MDMNTKEQTVKANNTLLYIILTIAAVLLGYVGYLHLSYELIQKKEFQKEYVLKSDIDFDMLPAHLQSQYVEFYDHNQQITDLTEKIQNLESTSQTFKEPKIIEKIIEVERIVKVPVEKIVEVEKIITIPIEIPSTVEDESILKNTKQFNTFTCKTMPEGSVKISKSCIKNLQNFLDKNKEAKKFEVIGMVDKKDFKFINTLKDVYGENKVKNLSKYSQIGLSRQRVIEASWVLKEYIGGYEKIKTVNYTVHTKNKKGFVVRAYK